MKRVAALYLPDWPIERLWRAEPQLAPSPDAAPARRAPRDAARTEGWRPGARWARSGAADEPAAVSAPAWGVPLVTAHRVGSRIVVAAASPSARAIGVRPRTTVTSARALHPELVVRDADPHGDRAELVRLAHLLALRWSPGVMVADERGLLIDMTGVAHLFGGEARMARRMARLLARSGFSARIAVADTVGAAQALACHGPEPIALCPPGAQAAMLALLPPAALRLDDLQRDRLRTLGIDTIGQLLAMPRGPVTRRFGASLVLQLDRALGKVAEPIEPVVPPERIAVVQRFAEPIATPEAIAHWLGVLVRRLAQALAERGLGARLVELAAERVDHVPQRFRIGLARASRDPAHLLRLLGRRIESFEPGYGIDAMTLAVRAADPLGPEALGHGLGDEAPDLAPLIDTLATRGSRTWRDRPVESEVPERSVAAVPPLDPDPRESPPPKPDDVRLLDTRAPLHPWHPRWPRPVRLLHRPERLDHVMADTPDYPPVRFRWRGRMHRVVRADGPERIAGEWWTRAGERHAVRDYFRVEDEDGTRFWLYRRGDGERAATGDLSWYLHGWFG